MFTNFKLTYCAERLRKYLVLFSPSLYYLTLHFKIAPWVRHRIIHFCKIQVVLLSSFSEVRWQEDLQVLFPVRRFALLVRALYIKCYVFGPLRS